VPVPAWVGHSQDQLNHAARYFPLVGVLVGLIAAAVRRLLAALVLPVSVAVVLGMAASVLATGAFHEDGFADACDGFGGGWDKAQVLSHHERFTRRQLCDGRRGAAAAGQMECAG
jgi:adenosylcobinamide-GDP ribazoletransferase